MPVAKLIAPTTKQEIPKLRVAAYCRVSSNSADQRNSFATQEHVYTKYIAEKQEWELVDIFADEGLSGMKADNRPEFQRMIRMCELHQIDLILTKSVSRFARNVKEALNYTRKLKLLGVGVQFEEEGINTLAMADEMLLNTFAAIAQEESKSISQNQRLSIVKRMEAGEYIASNAPYGYRLIDKKLVIYEPEAEVVRWIYRAYLNGLSQMSRTRTGLAGRCRCHRAGIAARPPRHTGRPRARSGKTWTRTGPRAPAAPASALPDLQLYPRFRLRVGRVPALSAQAPVPAGWAAVRSARCSQPEAGRCTAAGAGLSSS